MATRKQNFGRREGIVAVLMEIIFILTNKLIDY